MDEDDLFAVFDDAPAPAPKIFARSKPTEDNVEIRCELVIRRN